MDQIINLKAQAYDVLANMEVVHKQLKECEKQLKELEDKLNEINAQITDLYKAQEDAEIVKTEETDGN